MFHYNENYYELFTKKYGKVKSMKKEICFTTTTSSKFRHFIKYKHKPECIHSQIYCKSIFYSQWNIVNVSDQVILNLVVSSLWLKGLDRTMLAPVRHPLWGLVGHFNLRAAGELTTDDNMMNHAYWQWFVIVSLSPCSDVNSWVRPVKCRLRAHILSI